MKASDLTDKFRNIMLGKNRVKLIAFMGIAAVALILLSELIPAKKSAEPAESSSEVFSDTSKLIEAEERKLASLLSSVRGVGKAEVILSLEGSEEYIYAQDTEAERSEDVSRITEKHESKLVLTDRSGSKGPLVRKVLAPKFNGALVICDGGSDPNIRERVIKAVSAALDLPTSKICVECRN
ncbi:MAG: hypothetical protein IKP47_09240 [Ruminococcus sp.]|nr:hypothetical protein [Ruminococcus sp.]